MAYNPYKTVADRQRAKQEAEERLKKRFDESKKQIDPLMRAKKQKKKTVEELLKLIDLDGIMKYKLREPESYAPKSYNIDKQTLGLINHIFVKYPVPYFMYEAILIRDGKSCNITQRNMFREWFITLAQGGSFPKAVKGIMTRQEAAMFLRGTTAYSISDNIWWAKMRAAGMNNSLIDKLMSKLFSHFHWGDPHGNYADTIRFFVNHHKEMDNVTFGEITDFLVWKFRNEPTFSMKGRTVGSILRMSNEWHAMIQKATLGADVARPGMGYNDWQYLEDHLLWEMTELRNNKELMNEGRKQKHCVYGYVNACVSGRSAIFSLRCYMKLSYKDDENGNPIWEKKNDNENGRITVEVSPKTHTIVQVRGTSNRPPDDKEKLVLRHWSGEKGLTMSRYT